MLKRFGIPALYLVIVFLCGMAVGGFGDHFYLTKSEPPRPEQWKRQHLREMRSRLKLSDGQTAQLSAILDETRSEYGQLMDKNRPEMERIQAAQYAKVKAILRPDQVPEYDRYHAERERQRRAMPPR